MSRSLSNSEPNGVSPLELQNPALKNLLNGRDFSEFVLKLEDIAANLGLSRVSPRAWTKINLGVQRNFNRLYSLLVAAGEDAEGFRREHKAWCDARRKASGQRPAVNPRQHIPTIVKAKALRLKLNPGAPVEATACPNDLTMNDALRRKGFRWSPERLLWWRAGECALVCDAAVSLGNLGVEVKVKAR